MGHLSDNGRPIVLIHGWGGSFEHTWKGSGLVDLLEDAGKEVIGVDLLGHGKAPKPHEPEAYGDLTERVMESLPDGDVDLVGFSLGAITALRLTIDHPTRVNRLVLAGIGRNVVESDSSGAHEAIVAALEGHLDSENNLARLFVQYANQPGNDIHALTAILKRQREPFSASELASVTCPTMVVIGDQDFAGPGSALSSLIPHSRLVELKKCDHFATTENFQFFDAALGFLGAL